MKPCSPFSRWQRVVLSGLMSLGMVMMTVHLSHAERYSVTDLGSLGGGRTGATALNNSGKVVGWSTVPGNTPHVFLYQDNNILPLGGIPVGVYASAYGINNSDQVVGQTGDGRGFLRHGDAVTIFPAFVPGAQSVAYGINNLGAVVGKANDSARGYAVLYTPGKVPENLNVWKGRYSVAYAINDAGEVVGEAAAPNFGPFRAFKYHNKIMKDLGTLGDGLHSAAYAINSSGHVVGQSNFSRTSSSVRAVLYKPGEKPQELFGPVGVTVTSSSAKGINKSGQIVGWYNVSGYGKYAFVYKDGSMYDLNKLLDSSGAKWSLSEAIAINDNGQIICKAGSRAVLLTPVP